MKKEGFKIQNHFMFLKYCQFMLISKILSKLAYGNASLETGSARH